MPPSPMTIDERELTELKSKKLTDDDFVPSLVQYMAQKCDTSAYVGAKEGLKGLESTVKESEKNITKSCLSKITGAILPWHFYAQEHPDTELLFTQGAVFELFRACMPAHARMLNNKENKRYKQAVQDFGDIDPEKPADNFNATSMKLDDITRLVNMLGNSRLPTGTESSTSKGL